MVNMFFSFIRSVAVEKWLESWMQKMFEKKVCRLLLKIQIR